MKIAPNILIVDDSEINLILLENIIGHVDVNLIKMQSGQKALELTRDLELALAIIDVRMPEMNGYELAMKLNENRIGDKVPVIFLTASMYNDQDVNEGYSSGAVDFMAKPFNNHVIRSKVNIFLDLYKQKQVIIQEALQLKEAADELVRVNDALKKSEEKYRSYIDNAPDGVFVTDENGNYIEVNGSACRITGYSQEELLQLSVKDLLLEDTQDTGMDQLSQRAETQSLKTNRQFRHKDGSSGWWAIETVKLTETRFLGFAKDITERIELEESLSAHQIELEMQNDELFNALDMEKVASEKYTELYDFAPLGYFTLSEERTIVELNHSGALMLGKTRSQLISCHFGLFISPESLPVFNGFIQDIFESSAKKTCELVLVTDGGQTKYVIVEGMYVSHGKQCLLNVVDISGRKQAEDAVKEAATRLALATKAGGIGVWDLNLIDNSLLWDDHMYELYGVAKSDFIPIFKTWQDTVHADDKARSMAELQMALNGEKDFDTEFRICWPDGSIHILRSTAVVLYDDSGRPYRSIGINWDITEQKRLEENLKSSESNFRAFFETMNDMILVGNLQGEIIYANNALSETLGYSKEEIHGMPVLNLNPSDMHAEAQQIFSDMLAHKRDTCPLPLVRKNGTYVPADTHVWFGKWNGKDCIFGFSKDLSAEQEALQKFNKIFENNPALIAITSVPDGIFTDINQTFLTKVGYTKEEIVGKTAIDLGLFLETDQQLQASVDLEKNGIFRNLEFLVRTKSGKILDGLFSGEIIENQGKKYFLTVMVDITERKLAEDILRRSETSLAEAQRIAHMGSWEWDILSNTVKWSDEMFRVFDIDPLEYDGDPGFLLKVLHPDDVEIFTNSMSVNLNGGRAPRLEYRVVHKDGSVRNVLAVGRMEFDPSGHPIRNIGTVQDITERKKAEEAIRQANTFLDSIVENIPDMVFIKDIKTLQFIRFNKAGEELLGLTKEEIIGRTDYDFFRKELADGYTEKDRDVLLLKEMVDIPEELINTRFKGIRILHTRKVPILNSGGEPEYLLGISEDITELKLAEQAMKVNEEKYKTILNSSPDGVFLIDLEGIITEVSEIGIELFGVDNRNELLGKHIMRFVPSDEKETVREIIEKTMNEGLAQNVELKIRKKNQTLLFGEISSTLIQDPSGVPLSFMITIRDISQRKKMETKQFHADRMANLGEMASGIAHEINQPLNIISLVMDNILYEASKEENMGKEYLHKKMDKIFENIARIRNIIDHVRAFSRSNDDYILTGFDINSSISNAVSMISEQFKHLAITMDLQLQDHLPSIVGNTIKFEQVILNLLTNAKDALLEKKNFQQSDYEMLILIRSFVENQNLIVEITDNGSGISKEDIDHIMLPFYTTKDSGKGTGLGLSISYQIIKEINGTIEIASQANSGTTFRIILNIQQAQLA